MSFPVATRTANRSSAKPPGFAAWAQPIPGAVAFSPAAPTTPTSTRASAEPIFRGEALTFRGAASTFRSAERIFRGARLTFRGAG